MKRYLSPKDLAETLAVSESSVKRWADNGRIAVTRTGGGHRRIALEEVVRFVRRTNAEVSCPEVLGFGEVGHVPWRHLSQQALAESLYKALINGQSNEALAYIHGPFLAGRPLARLFDGPVRGAMQRIGELWKHQGDGILLEHRATDICVQAIMRILLSLPVESDAPVSVGGAGPEDPYLLPTLMTAALMRDLGMRHTSLGPQTPLAVYREAVMRFHPSLVCLSVSVDKVAEAIRPDLLEFADDLGEHSASLVIGGRAIGKLADLRHHNLTIAHSMAELATFTRGLLASLRAHKSSSIRNPKESS